jgi:hypothetical protein
MEGDGTNADDVEARLVGEELQVVTKCLRKFLSMSYEQKDFFGTIVKAYTTRDDSRFYMMLVPELRRCVSNVCLASP